MLCIQAGHVDGEFCFAVNSLTRKDWESARIYIYNSKEELTPRQYHDDYKYDPSHNKEPVTITGFMAPAYLPSLHRESKLPIVRSSYIDTSDKTSESTTCVQRMHFVEGLCLGSR